MAGFYDIIESMSGHSTPVCTLMSGGLDSGLLLHHLLRAGSRAVPVYLRCGLQWEETELYWLRRFLRAVHSRRLAPLRTVGMPLGEVYGSHWSLTGRHIPDANSPETAVYLPGRNVLLVSAAAILCAQRRISTIALGVLKGNPFGDASRRCLGQLATCLSQALRHPIRILTPLRRSNKAQLIRSAVRVPLELTFSCLRPIGRRHCGRCNKCAERSRAFQRAGVSDPTDYASPVSCHPSPVT